MKNNQQETRQTIATLQSLYEHKIKTLEDSLEQARETRLENRKLKSKISELEEELKIYKEVKNYKRIIEDMPVEFKTFLTTVNKQLHDLHCYKMREEY